MGGLLEELERRARSLLATRAQLSPGRRIPYITVGPFGAAVEDGVVKIGKSESGSPFFDSSLPYEITIELSGLTRTEWAAAVQSFRDAMVLDDLSNVGCLMNENWRP